jgi:hypothetical protein
MLVSVGRELRLCISQPKTNRRFRMEKANPLKEKTALLARVPSTFALKFVQSVAFGSITHHHRFNTQHLTRAPMNRISSS